MTDRTSIVRVSRIVFTVLVAAIFLGGAFVSTAQAVPPASINLSSPLGEEHWRGVQNITWTGSAAPSDLVAIYYSTDNFANSTPIATNILFSDGTYAWDTTSVLDGTAYRVMVQIQPLLSFSQSPAAFTIDNTSPVLTIPANVGPVEATGPLTIVDPGIATATDNLDPAPVVTNDTPANFPVGITTITYTATDWAGNASTATQTIEVVDTTAPVIAAHGDESATAPTSVGVPVTYILPIATDIVDGTVPVTCVPASGSTFPVGDTTVTCNATDAHGNAAAPTHFHVVVTDNVAPSVLGYTLNGSAQNVAFNPGTVSITVTASELVNWISAKIYLASDPGVYKTKLPAGDGTDTGTFPWDGSLSAGGPGPVDGVYNLSVHITDLAGNDVPVTELTPYTITVDTVSPTIAVTSPVAETVYKSDPALSFTASDPAPGTAIECSYSIDSGVSVPVDCVAGTATLTGLSDARHSVVVTAEDAAGNSFSSPAVSFVYDNNDTLTVPSDFTTIQAAVNAATTNDTILVSAGTYPESVLITKILNIAGVGSERPIITGMVGPNYILKLDSVAKASVTNLEINGGGLGAGDNAFDYGILVNNSGSEANPVDIGSITVKNIWKVSSNGIGIEGSSYALVHNSNISSFHKRGIRFINSEGKFYSNEVVGDNVDGTSRVQNLVTLWGGSDVEIYSNILHGGMSITPGTWDSPAVFVSSYGGSGASTANVHDNEIYSVDTGVVVGSVYAGTDTSSATIAHNNIHDLHSAINFEKGTVSATITHNKLSAFTKGVSADDGSGGPTPRPTVDAEENWWSRVSGPQTSEVYSEVDYSPWCTNEACTELGSNDPLNHIELVIAPASVTIPATAIVTITSKDVADITRVNESAQVSLTADGGATFGSTLLSFTNGVATTTVANSVAGIVHVTATVVGGTQAATEQAEFTNAVVPPPTGHVVTWEAKNNFAQADGTYLNGWHYVFKVTVYDTAETDLSVRFDDWVNNASSSQVVPASPNMRLLINQAGGIVAGVGSESIIENGSGNIKSYALGNAYADQTLLGVPTPIDISAIDLDNDLSNGRQIQFDVFTKIPVGTAPGFYSTGYGIQTDVPVI